MVLLGLGLQGLGFTFLDMSSPFDSLYETSVSGSSGVKGQLGHSGRQDVSRNGDRK